MDEIDRMDMTAFSRLECAEEESKKEPRRAYIDEVWSNLKPLN